MQLSDFLATLSPTLTPQEKLDLAVDYAPTPYLWRAEGSVRKTQIETGFIINDTRSRLAGIINDPSTPPMKKAIAEKVLSAADKLWYPEFYLNLADTEVLQLFSLAHTLEVLNQDEVTRITNACMHTPPKSFPNATLHDVLIALNDCPTKPVAVDNGWVILTTEEDCPSHNPRLLALNPRTNQWQRINNFYGVATAGVYECLVPREHLNAELRVDNAYGVIL
jgi:hypothetical protein